MFQRKELDLWTVLALASLATLLWPSEVACQADLGFRARALREAANFEEIPGLYDKSDIVTPIQGEQNFEQLVLNGNSSEALRPESQLISLVQFYMATCPDCQGFSPYFKRFISDVGPFWGNFIRIYVVNCNDDENIHVCWKQNPILTVPLIRWYAFPALIKGSKFENGSQQFNFPRDLMNVDHRSFIAKQRRDLISLRHATLKYVGSVLSQLQFPSGSAAGDRNNLDLYNKLPLRWRLLQPLGKTREPLVSHEQARRNWALELRARAGSCVREAKLAKNATILNLMVFERRTSYAGRTLVADWSNWVCSEGAPAAYMVHYSNDFALLPAEFNRFQQSAEPLLLKFELSAADQALPQKWSLLASNGTTSDNRARRHLQPNSHREGLSRRLPLDQYYDKRRSLDNTYAFIKSLDRFRRTTASLSERSQLVAENINWAPNELYPGEEELRYQFNKAASETLFPSGDKIKLAGFASGNQGEIERSVDNSSSDSIVDPKTEDLTRLRLTDFYKVLAEIVHRNFLSKAQVDSFQLLASSCFLKQLARHFPFQGLSSGKRRSISKAFIESLHNDYQSKLTSRLLASNSTLLGRLPGGTGGWCEGELAAKLSGSNGTQLDNLLRGFKFSGNELEAAQARIRREQKVGLPAENNFSWSYCAGSKPYLRGHTCSLWLLFHSLGVNEYLAANNISSSLRSAYLNVTVEPEEKGQLEYQFQIRYSNDSLALCDPKDPEPALLNATTRQLFVPENQFVLGSLISFVRLYLSCTNCAAHFSCMVASSPPKLDHNSLTSGQQLLWLWEAHNRVNVRTRKTHSEDPQHPKHVFPAYEACSECYLERPREGHSFEALKFNREKVIQFLVARHKRISILNNKIRIEELFGRPLQPQAGGVNKPK